MQKENRVKKEIKYSTQGEKGKKNCISNDSKENSEPKL